MLNERLGPSGFDSRPAQSDPLLCHENDALDSLGRQAVSAERESRDFARVPQVTIVSVTYNRCDDLIRLLHQLEKLEYPPHCTHVIVVDNGSTDDTVDRVGREFPNVQLVEARENLGVSAGFNRGMREALGKDSKSKYIWLLDSDAEIEPTTLARLVEAMESESDLGVVGSVVHDPRQRERAVTSGLTVEWNRGELRFVPSQARASELVDVDLIPACSLLTRSEICRALGLWDEQYWLYWGDTDWCVRVKQAGWRVCCHSRSRAWHRDWAGVRREFTAAGVMYDDLRGALLFNLRNHPRGSVSGTRRLILKGYCKAAAEFLTARQHFGRAYRRAIDDFLAGRFGKPDLEEWSRQTPTQELEQICESLRERIPPNASILLNQIGDPRRREAIRDAFGRAFPEARWREISPRNDPTRADLTSEYGHYFRFQLPQLLLRLLTPHRRCHVIVTDVAKPHLYCLVSARYTVLLDSSLRGLLATNRIAAGFFNALTTFFTGLKRAYWDLPRAWRSNRRLQDALANRSNTSPESASK